MNRRRAGLVAAIFVVGGCGKPGGTAAKVEPVASPSTSVAPASTVSPLRALYLKMEPLGCVDAFEVAKPQMTDSVNEDSDGATVFALWAADKMRWADVGVDQDETTPALVKKNSDSERGKRICANAQIIQIKDEKLANGGHVSNGLLQSDAGNLYRFLAAGSSGTLVEQSYAHFCGFVTGTYDYSNSAGGTGHAVSLVGMFDLPANKASLPLRRE